MQFSYDFRDRSFHWRVSSYVFLNAIEITALRTLLSFIFNALPGTTIYKHFNP